MVSKKMLINNNYSYFLIKELKEGLTKYLFSL